ncbi:hypothetical protein DXG01_012629 [Tephrocybe rancida]|nr:hypothetical protein DXG01_012629 [Tephrocybe rancida]
MEESLRLMPHQLIGPKHPQPFLDEADGLVYLDQPSTLQVEDVKDFSQSLFIEVKPVLSWDGKDEMAVPFTCAATKQPYPRDEAKHTLKAETELTRTTETPGHAGYLIPYITTSSMMRTRIDAVKEGIDQAAPMQDAQLFSAQYNPDAPLEAVSVYHEDSVMEDSDAPNDFLEDTPAPLRVKSEAIEVSVFPDQFDVEARAGSFMPDLEPQPTIDPRAIESDVAAPSAAERRRCVLDAVEVPTLSPAMMKRYTKLGLVQDRRGSVAKSEKMLGHLKNPKVKKVEVRKFDADSVRARLEPIGLDVYPIPLDKTSIDTTYLRELINSQYGGSSRSNFVTISSKRVAVHGLNNFMFPTFGYNPDVPQVPGAPGLWYTIAQGENIARAHPSFKAEEQRVITRLSTDDGGIWQYQGQYKLAPTDSLTKDEWAVQDEKVRNTWARDIYEKGWGRPTRARISLRDTLKRVPTKRQLSKALNSDQDFRNVTPERISRALLAGEETMAMWTMKCVGYDTKFQRDLIEKKKTWVPKPKGSKKQEAEVGTNTKRAVSSEKARGRKRKCQG